MSRAVAVTPDQFASFGDLLKYLRRRAGLTQRELSIAVGYSDSHISRFEQNQRAPDAATLAARFVPALQIESEKPWADRLLVLAEAIRKPGGAPQSLAVAGASTLLDRLAGGHLVGRQAELELLTNLWARVQQGGAHLALLAGEAGIGKTRLARELQQRVRSEGGLVIAGASYEFEALTPYLPITEGLQAWAEEQSDAALREILGAAAPDLARFVPAIQDRLKPPQPQPGLPPGEERVRLFDTLARFLHSLAAGGGLLMYMDDLQWADQGTLAMITFLARRLREARVLFLGSYREADLDSGHPLRTALVAWNRDRLMTRITLGRLTKAETTAMLAALFELPTVSAEFGEVIYRETEGNPYFIEEVVRSLIEQGDIYPGEAGWDRHPLAALVIPQSIREAIERRLARLGDGAGRVLQTAATLGKTFSFDELAAVLGDDEGRLLDVLDDACRAQLVRPAGGQMFVFTHDKIREVLYQDQNPVRRRHLHQRIAAGLEKVYAAPPLREAHITDIAHHFVRGGDQSKGLEYSLAAARHSGRVYAHDEALRYYQLAEECARALNQPAQLAAIYENMADVNYQRGMFPAAAALYQQALALVSAEDRSRRAVLNRKAGDALAQVGDERGLEFLQLAERELDPVAQADEAALALTWIGRYHHYRGQHRAAIEYYERARRLAEPLGRTDILLFICNCSAGAFNHLTLFNQSDYWARRTLELGQTADRSQARAMAYEHLAENALSRGSWEPALEYAAHDREIARRIGALNREAWAACDHVHALYGQGSLQAALDAARAGLLLAEQVDEGRVVVLLNSLLTMITSDVDLDEAALAYSTAGLARSEELAQVFMQCVGRHGLAYYHLRRGEWEQAVAIHEGCEALVASTESRIALLWLGPYPALARLGAGRVGEAAQLAADSLALAREAEAPHAAGCALRAQGQVFMALDLPVQAAAVFDESIALLESQGSQLELGRSFHQRALMEQKTGRREAALRDLLRARGQFTHCGATRDLALVNRDLQELGHVTG